MVFAHWISHTTYCKVTGIAKRRDIPVEYINSRNLSISERELPEAACGLLLKLNRDFRPVQSFSAKHGEQVPGASLSS